MLSCWKLSVTLIHYYLWIAVDVSLELLELGILVFQLSALTGRSWKDRQVITNKNHHTCTDPTVGMDWLCYPVSPGAETPWGKQACSHLTESRIRLLLFCLTSSKLLFLNAAQRETVCVCVCACVCVCMNAYMHVCMPACMHVCAYICKCTCRCVCECVWVHACMCACYPVP